MLHDYLLGDWWGQHDPVPPRVGPRVHVRGGRLPRRPARPVRHGRVCAGLVARGVRPRRIRARRVRPRRHDVVPSRSDVLHRALRPCHPARRRGGADVPAAADRSTPSAVSSRACCAGRCCRCSPSGSIYFVLIGFMGSSSVSTTYGITASDSWVEEAGLAVFPALFALVPLALVMGILRYRLWDIDVLVSRTLLSVGLAAFIGVVYVVVVVGLGHGLGPGDSAALKIVATAIAAIAFEPVRERLQRLANRLVYGERASPYEVMAEFADRLAGAISVDEVLPRTAEAVARGRRRRRRSGHRIPARRRRAHGPLAAGRRRRRRSPGRQRVLPGRAGRRDRRRQGARRAADAGRGRAAQLAGGASGAGVQQRPAHHRAAGAPPGDLRAGGRLCARPGSAS